MTVTVFIPAYNVEGYVGEAIESVLYQTFTDWELVIVDDCSVDNTYLICEQYAARDSRIKLYRNAENRGMMENWVYGMDLCKGKYWCKLDADDIWMPQMLESCVQILENREDVGMVVTRYINMDERGNIIADSSYQFPDFARNQAISFLPFVKSGVHNMFTHHVAQQGIGLIRRRIFDELGNFTLLPAGDTEMWFRIGAHYKVFCLDQLLHYHRIWPNNFTRTQVLRTNRIDKNLHDVRTAIFDYYYKNGFINKVDYLQLSRDNQYEWNKTCIAQALHSRDYRKVFRPLAWNFVSFPIRTFCFYGSRLLRRD